MCNSIYTNDSKDILGGHYFLIKIKLAVPKRGELYLRGVSLEGLFVRKNQLKIN